MRRVLVGGWGIGKTGQLGRSLKIVLGRWGSRLRDYVIVWLRLLWQQEG